MQYHLRKLTCHEGDLLNRYIWELVCQKLVFRALIHLIEYYGMLLFIHVIDTFSWHKSLHIEGLVQERRNSSALAMELRFYCTNPMICDWCCFSSMSFSIRLHFQYKDCLSMYMCRDFHYKDKTVKRPSYLYNENPKQVRQQLCIETACKNSEECRFVCWFICFKYICTYIYLCFNVHIICMSCEHWLCETYQSAAKILSLLTWRVHTKER